MCGNVFVLCQPRWPGQTPIPHHHFDTWNSFLDVTSGMVKDPVDVLDRQKCLDALAVLRHAKWFQVRNIILLSSCSLMRCIISVYSFVWFFWVIIKLFIAKAHTHIYSRMSSVPTKIWSKYVVCRDDNPSSFESLTKNLLAKNWHPCIPNPI